MAEPARVQDIPHLASHPGRTDIEDGPQDHFDKQAKYDAEIESDLDSRASILSNSFTRRLLKIGIEEVGVQPIPEHERTDTRSLKVATMWMAMNIGIIP